MKDFVKKYSLIIVGILSLLVGYFNGNIKSFGDLASAAGAIEWSNEAAVETLEKNTGGDVDVVNEQGDEVISPEDDK